MTGSRSPSQIKRIKQNGEQIAKTPGVIRTKSSVRWYVKSQSVESCWYLVTLSTQGLVCSCPGNMDGKVICKHAWAIDVIMRKEYKAIARKTAIKRKVVKCRYCKSKNFKKTEYASANTSKNSGIYATHATGHFLV